MYENLPETDITIAQKMLAIKDQMGRHKRQKSLRANVGNMQNSVSSILKKAFDIGKKLPQQKEPVDDEKRINTLINTFRRGWRTNFKDHTDPKTEIGSSEETTGMNQINTNSPDLNIY